MKKHLIFLLLISIIVIFIKTISLKTYASSSTSQFKGFDTQNLTYVSDTYIEDVKIISEKGNYYGSYSMWASNYKYYKKNDNGSYSLYLLFFIESSINSSGNSKKRNYFRNKDLNISFSLSSQKTKYISMTSCDNGAQTTTSKSFGIGGNIGYDGGFVSTLNASYSISNTASYNSVVLNTSKSSNERLHQAYFNYHFLNYKNGWFALI